MSYICTLCKKDFDRHQNYINHINRKNPCVKKLDCDRCHKSFSRIDSYKRHVSESKCLIKPMPPVKSTISDKSSIPLEKSDKLPSIYNMNNNHIEIKELRKIMEDQEQSEDHEKIIKLYRLVYNDENKILYRYQERSDDSDMADHPYHILMHKNKWESKRLSKNILTDILRYLFHAIEAKVLKDDPMGTSKLYNDLVSLRQDKRINIIIKTHRSTLENLIPIKNINPKEVKQIKKEMSIMYSPESKKNCVIEESIRTSPDMPKIDLLEDLSPYNSDDETFYQKSMNIFKTENKLLCTDGSIIENIKYESESDDEFESDDDIWE